MGFSFDIYSYALNQSRINALKKRAWHEDKTKSGANKNYTMVAVNFKAANSRSMQAGIW